ncbi:winged helix-turn-helix transcriptional regulator [Salinibacterium soli]|uniref:Helix-turn-helix domain-containing protein n=1 Tax=Antiquaquibacter soli TaxID=3064523 RepID=A0ABT9BHZ6_9MICO|nr:helix-turn-helix domain-containing protein [Protaetiibacter sp. WY-16]MDO7880641.1 helix-turn-helix domain-containing protein [Protaetiibacter sp. WY-16]
MDPTEFNARCSIARSLDVLGEKWTLLILREAFRGRARFSEFRDSLGVARDILANRLATLVEYGVLEKRAYRDENARERFEYVLTPAGRDLRVVLVALTEWGDRHRALPTGPSVAYVEEASGQPVHLEFVTADGRPVPASVVTSVFADAV